MIPMLTLLSSFALGTAHATEVGARPFGLGIVLGDPTGLSGKYYFGANNAVDMALGGDTFGGNQGSIYLHATYLWHPSILADTSAFALPWHVGIGGFIGDGGWGWNRNNRNWNGGTYAGVRAPIGLDMDFHSAPLQVFGDVAVHLLIVPAVDLDFDMSLGIRYYF